MTLAEDLYCGDEGAAYWQRNSTRLQNERGDRVRVLRNLVHYNHQIGWLEVGCGRGYNLLPGDVGLDCDPRQLAFLPLSVIPIIGHAYNLSLFPDNSFEVVFSVGCLMHLPSSPTPVSYPIGQRPKKIHWDTWQEAAEEMARVSSRYVILGEYWGEQEEPVTGKHWEGCLWRRPYTVPGRTLIKTVQPLLPFDPDVTFTVWE